MKSIDFIPAFPDDNFDIEYNPNGFVLTASKKPLPQQIPADKLLAYRNQALKMGLFIREHQNAGWHYQITNSPDGVCYTPEGDGSFDLHCRNLSTNNQQFDFWCKVVGACQDLETFSFDFFKRPIFINVFSTAESIEHVLHKLERYNSDIGVLYQWGYYCPSPTEMWEKYGDGSPMTEETPLYPFMGIGNWWDEKK